MTPLHRSVDEVLNSIAKPNAGGWTGRETAVVEAKQALLKDLLEIVKEGTGVADSEYDDQDTLAFIDGQLYERERVRTAIRKYLS